MKSKPQTTVGKYRCLANGCEGRYNKRELLRVHAREKHDKVLVKFLSLVDNVYQWGYEYVGSDAANKFRKQPSDYALQMSVLLHILDTLKDIRYELRKEKKVINL